jgi:cholesterol transport system auxiliary component
MNIPKLFSCLMACVLTTSCTGLQAPKVEVPHLYLLDAKVVSKTSPSNQILAISLPDSRPGLDTPKLAYQRHPLELEYFATHRWADTPARMLKPLLTQALEPHFRAVVPTPGTVAADLRLDTELIHLQQNFNGTSSQIQLTLRAQLIDMKNKRLIAVSVFDESENADSNDAYAGVLASNRALQRVLTQLIEFCLSASARQ